MSAPNEESDELDYNDPDTFICKEPDGAKPMEIEFSFDTPRDFLARNIVGSEEHQRITITSPDGSEIQLKGRMEMLGTDEVAIPSNKWQAFKQRWFPQFVLYFFPIVTTKTTVATVQFIPCDEENDNDT